MATRLPDLQQQWKALLVAQKWKPLFDSLSLYVSTDSHLANTLVLQQADHYRINSDANNSLLSAAEARMVFQNLTNGVNYLIDEVEIDDLVPGWERLGTPPPPPRGAGSDPGERPERPASRGATWFVGIGINDYAHWPRLNNAVHDMEAVAALLEAQYGVRLKTMLRDAEATLDNIIQLFDTLVKEIAEADSLILYFSGHGHLDKTTERGFLVPVDAKARGTAGFIRNSTLRDYFQDFKGQHLLFVSDACFSGSLLVSDRSGAEALVLTELAARPSRWVLTSGRHDETVSDGPRGGHSPFAQALIDELQHNTKPAINAAALAQSVQLTCKQNDEDQLTDYGPIAGAGDKRGQLVLWRKDFDVVDIENDDNSTKIHNLVVQKSIPDMTIEALTALTVKIYGFIRPVITSELGKEIAGDFKEASKDTMREIWQKLKPWFIIDDKEIDELKDVKADPTDAFAEEVFVAKLKAKLNKDVALRDEVAQLIENLEKSDALAAAIVITNSSNVNTGNISGVTGNVHIGDVIHGTSKDR